MRNLLATLLSTAMLLGAMPAGAEESTFSEEIFNLWSEAYESDELQDADLELWELEQAEVPAHREEYGSSDGSAVRSSTPSLDRLLGHNRGAMSAQEAVRPSSMPRSVGHETFFENPPMTTQSKGYSGSDGSRYSDRRDRDRKRCGHYRSCRCHNQPTPPPPGPPTPTPEPGTLFLAGSAAVAALGARRRARRKQQEAEKISD